MHRSLIALAAMAVAMWGMSTPWTAAADTVAEGSCADGSGRAWKGRVVWGPIYTDSSGVKRVTVNYAGWTTNASVVPTTYSRISVYNGAGGWEQTLEATYPNVDYGGGTIYKVVDPRDPKYYADRQALIKITLGSGAGNCSMSFLQPTDTGSTPPPPPPSGTTTDANCTDGSGRAWKGRVVWGPIYTDGAGVKRITVNYAGWTTNANVVPTTYSRISVYNGAGGWEQTLEATYPNVDYGGGTIYKVSDPRDPKYYAGQQASVKISLGSGGGTCSMRLLEPTTDGTPPPTAGDKLPDLVMRKISDVSIDTTSTQGVKKLRFTTIIGNRAGFGPMELTGTRPAGSTADMTTVQRIYRTDGTSYTRPTAAVMYFAGDGHTHWHTKDLARFNLHSKTSTGAEGGVVRAQQKHGFCFFDNSAFGGTAPEKYTTCGTNSSVSTQTMGLSSGWGDKYGATLVDQYVDVTGLADGVYRVRLTVDADDWFKEADETNNSNWTDLEIRGNSVTVGASGGALF